LGEPLFPKNEKEAAMGFGWNYVFGTILVEIGKSALWFLLGLAD